MHDFCNLDFFRDVIEGDELNELLENPEEIFEGFRE